MLLSSHWITEEIKDEIKKKIPQDKWKWNYNSPKLMGCSKSSSKREVYSNTILPQKIRKTLKRQPNFTLKTTGKTNKQTNKKNRKNPKLLEGNKLCRSQQK